MGATHRGSDVALVGRASELEALCRAVDLARRGRMHVMLIEGEAGIGKTRLLTATLGHAERTGVRVLLGACDEIERDRPLRAIADALVGSRPDAAGQRLELARLLADRSAPAESPAGVMGSVDTAWLVVETALDVIEEFAAAGPVALAIEDLQWADPLTLRTMHAIPRRLARLPFVLLTTLRRGSRRADVDRVVTGLIDGGGQRIEVGPLTADEAAELAGEVAGNRPGPGLLQHLGDAGGNPLFVIEMMRALREDDALELLAGRIDVPRVWPPATLRVTLLRRLSQLPEDELSLLRLASVLGSRFSVTELSMLADRRPAQLLPALTASVQAGLLTDEGDQLAFHHDLIRDVLYYDVPESIRVSLHREAGEALANGGAPLDRVASHVSLGALPGDVEAARWLHAAARRVAPRTPATAIALLERAREVVARSDPIDEELTADMVVPLLAVGRLSDAEAVARDVLARGPGRRFDAFVRTSLANVLSMQARYPEAIQELEAAVASAPDAERLVLDATRSMLMVLAGRLEQARSTARRAVDAAERAANDHALCLGLQALALVALADGNVPEAVSSSQRATTVLERNDAEWATYLVPQLWYGTALADADQFGPAEAALRAGQRRADRSGNVSRIPLYHWALGELRVGSGQWDDAVVEAEAGLVLVAESASRVGDVFAHALCAHVALHRGDLTLAQANVNEAERRLVAGPVEIGFEYMAWVGALLLETRGQRAQALDRVATAWDQIAPVRYLQAMSRAMGPDLVRIALAEDDVQRAASVTEELERSAELARSPTARGLALRCRGLLSRDVDALLLSVAAHREGPRPYPLAAACEDAGDACRRHDRPAEAVRLLREAAATYEGLGAVWDIERVRPKLHALGVRDSRRVRQRPTFGWESLTPTEARVVGFVTQGLTNREIADRMFVSRRTVATHVEHVFQKLGHANRVELAADHARRTSQVEAMTRPGQTAP